jgi:hypothetical protein
VIFFSQSQGEKLLALDLNIHNPTLAIDANLMILFTKVVA